MKPAIRRTTVDNAAPDGWFLDGDDYTRSEVIELLVNLPFGRRTGHAETLHIDCHIRDLLVRALRRP